MTPSTWSFSVAPASMALRKSESETTPNDIVSVIVTEPLTSDETWDIYKPGEWRLWRQGVVVMQGSEL